jgi:hypothetical protein
MNKLFSNQLESIENAVQNLLLYLENDNLVRIPVMPSREVRAVRRQSVLDR